MTGEEGYRPVPKSWRTARNALLGLSLAAWLLMSAVIALAGWGTRSALHQNFGLVLMGLGLVLGGGGYLSSRLKLKRQAASSLQARADLEGLELAEPMEATLVVFDLTHDRVRQLLEEPALRDVVDTDVVRRDLSVSGEELYDLAKRHRTLQLEAERLERQSKTSAVENAMSSNARERQRIEEASNRIAEELQSLQAKVEDTRGLARAVTRGEEETDRLRESTRALDASAAAIKEIAQLK